MAKAKSLTEVSIREFAKQIKVSHTAVQKAIKDGKFTKGYNKVTGKISLAMAKKDDWVIMQSNPMARPGISKAKALEKLQKSGQKEEKIEEKAGLKGKKIQDMTAFELIACMEVTSSMPLAQAMRYREIIALQLDKIKLQKEEGILVDKDAVNGALFKLGNEMKKELLNIPKRIARDVMAAPNEVEAINILNDEFNRVLSFYGSLKLNKV